MRWPMTDLAIPQPKPWVMGIAPYVPGKSAGAKGSNVHGQRHTRI